ncbi:MAG: c-type cytochrome [Acetobacteraceae bacterium]|nr:c-type cytochrome [Acetobacteraceae bacterium]MBV8521816.1 c-type cytochrome [Acetobacteraceae bacterium]MBV8592563.1 c-type cytochrome [Acetobacteraceae bacterium]
MGRLASSLVLVLPWLALGGFGAAIAQGTPEGASAAEGEKLFKQQCAACHSLSASDPPRQGPPLAGVYGRKPGSAPGFKYSSGYAKADFGWDEQHLDAYLTNPQAVIPGSNMLYRQSKPQVRQAIIAYLKEQH